MKNSLAHSFVAGQVIKNPIFTRQSVEIASNCHEIYRPIKDICHIQVMTTTITSVKYLVTSNTTASFHEHINTLVSGGLRLKSNSSHVFLHGNISTDDCAKELFKPSKDSASLRVYNEKKIFGFWFCFLCE